MFQEEYMDIFSSHLLTNYLWSYFDFKDVLNINLVCRDWHRTVINHQEYWFIKLDRTRCWKRIRDKTKHLGEMYRWCIPRKVASRLQLNSPRLGKWNEYWDVLDEEYYPYCAFKDHWVFKVADVDYTRFHPEKSSYYWEFIRSRYLKDKVNFEEQLKERQSKLGSLVEKLKLEVELYRDLKFLSCGSDSSLEQEFIQEVDLDWFHLIDKIQLTN